MIKYLEKEEDFDKLIQEEVIVDFYADWCGPCKMVGATLEEIEEFNVLKVNVDDFKDIAIKYGIMSIPTLIKFKGGEEVKKVIGYRSKEELLEDFK